MKSPRISVVIPTYRREDLLARCLDALELQSLPAHAFELIIVDDGHSQETRILCENRAARLTGSGPMLRYLRPHGGTGPAVARNCGWRAALGELIAFTDDDTVPDRDWLRQGEAALLPSHRIAVWGRVRVPKPAVMSDHARNTSGLENAVFVTANVFVRRRSLEAVGGFDERYQRAWREDTDLYFALLEVATTDDAIAPAPEALVLHPVRRAKLFVSVGQQANMAFDALLYKKHPLFYDQHVGLRHPPPAYSAIALATLAAAATLPVSRTVSAVLASSALVLILRFAAYRLRGLAKSPREILDVLVSSFAIPYLSIFWRFYGAFYWRVRFY